MYFVGYDCSIVCLVEGFFKFCYRERLVVAFSVFALKLDFNLFCFFFFDNLKTFALVFGGFCGKVSAR